MSPVITSGFIQGKHMPHMNNAAMGLADTPNVTVTIVKADLPADAIIMAKPITASPTKTTEINQHIAGHSIVKYNE